MEIVVVDDHQLFLDGFGMLLSKLNHEVNLHTYENADKALSAIIENNDIDLVILDMSLPDLDGVEVLKKAREQGILVPVVFVSASDNIYKIACTYYYGGNGFIPKTTDTEEMLQALQQVLEGEIYFPPDMKLAIEQQLQEIQKIQQVREQLTSRQLEVLKIMAQGASNKEIAEALFISEPTVKSHISIIYQLFNVNKRVECIRKAEWLGIL